MVRQIFKNKVIAAAGPLEGQLTVENLQRWTKLCKGVFVDQFSDEVTHLLCTEKQFKKKNPIVKAALKRRKTKGHKMFHIVHADWFEFCTTTNKKEPEEDFSMLVSVAQENAARREAARIEQGKRNGERFVNTNYYHIYTDREGFQYRVDLTRDCQDVGERWKLELWESNAKPHLHWFTIGYAKKKGARLHYEKLSKYPQKWRHEFNLFQKVFRKHTGIDWEQRVSRAHTMPDTVYQYSPPTGGKPVGRRLAGALDECLEVNARLRGLPWPPPETTSAETEGEQLVHNVGPVPYVAEDGDEVMSTAGPDEDAQVMLSEFATDAQAWQDAGYDSGYDSSDSDHVPDESEAVVATDGVVVGEEAGTRETEVQEFLSQNESFEV